MPFTCRCVILGGFNPVSLDASPASRPRYCLHRQFFQIRKASGDDLCKFHRYHNYMYVYIYTSVIGRKNQANAYMHDDVHHFSFEILHS